MNLRMIAQLFVVVPMLILATYGIPQAKSHISANERATIEANEKATIEAYTLAWGYFTSSTLKCGDSYYHRVSEEFTHGPIMKEIKKVGLRVSQWAITAADRANGLTWKGSVNLLCEMLRSYEVTKIPYTNPQAYEGRWGEWVMCTPPDRSTDQANWVLTSVMDEISILTKRQGKWYGALGAPFPSPRPSKLTCDKIPK